MYIYVLVFIFINVCSLEKIPDDEVSKACNNSVVNVSVKHVLSGPRREKTCFRGF